MAENDIYRVTLEFQDTDAGGPFMSSSYSVIQDAGTWDSQAVMSCAFDWWDAGYTGIDPAKSHFATTVALTNITSRRIDPLEPIIIASTETFPVAGTDTGNSLPPNSATLLSIRTEKIGRSYRGRMFLPPCSEADSAGNMVEADAQELADAFAALCNATATTLSGGRIGVYSQVLGTFEPATDVKVDRRLRVQRRRQPAAQYKSTSV